MATVLWGDEHTRMGEVVVSEVGRRVAVALTRGFLPKPYRYVDPNEDTVAAVVGPRATLLVVADGHNGFQATDAVIRHVLDRLGEDPPPADLAEGELVGLFHDAGRAVLARTRGLPPPHRESRTTLTVALLAGRRLQWAAMGDSALLVASAGAGRELTRPRQEFVGFEMDRRDVADRLRRDVVELEAGEWVVLVSDGFTNFTTAPSAAEAVGAAIVEDASPAAVARDLVEHAGRGGAGDNVAVAVAAPEPP